MRASRTCVAAAGPEGPIGSSSDIDGTHLLRHAALTKLTLYGVAAFEGCVQAGDWIGLRSTSESGPVGASRSVLAMYSHDRTRKTLFIGSAVAVVE